MKTQTIVILVVALIIIAIGGFLVFRLDSTDSQPRQQEVISEADLVSLTAYSKGSPVAAVRIVEFSDFQCPACAAEFPILKKISEDYKDKIQFVYRHFPLPQHTNAKPAAYAAEAAGKQGKFWEMHDKLFENQNKLSDETIKKLAADIGLDINRFEADRKSDAVAAVVNADVVTANRLKVSATPTLFINGTRFQGGLSYDQLKREIEARSK